MSQTALYVRKPLNLIFSKQNYTALEMDINTVFLAHLPSQKEGEEWPEDKEFIVSFRVAEQLKEINYTRIKKALSGLNSKRVEVVDDEGQECVYSSIYPETKLQDGVITLHMRGKYIRDYTKLTSGYGGWFVRDYIKLSRDIHKSLFEMCCSAVNRKINRLEFEIKILKEDLGIADQYIHRNKECFERSILPTVDVINERTSLLVTPAMQRKGRKTFVMLLVERKSDQSNNQAPPQEPKEEGQQNQQLSGGKEPAFPDARQTRCYQIMLDWGFTKSKAFNCASNIEKMELFYSWKYSNAIDPAIKDGKLTKKQAQGMFFGELKKNGMKI